MYNTSPNHPARTIMNIETPGWRRAMVDVFTTPKDIRICSTFFSWASLFNEINVFCIYTLCRSSVTYWIYILFLLFPQGCHAHGTTHELLQMKRKINNKNSLEWNGLKSDINTLFLKQNREFIFFLYENTTVWVIICLQGGRVLCELQFRRWRYGWNCFSSNHLLNLVTKNPSINIDFFFLELLLQWFKLWSFYTFFFQSVTAQVVKCGSNGAIIEMMQVDYTLKLLFWSCYILWGNYFINLPLI